MTIAIVACVIRIDDTKLQPFQGALMVFGGHWKSWVVIGGYWWKKRGENLHKSRKFSNFGILSKLLAFDKINKELFVFVLIYS